jgi:hypothetical protein
MAASIDYQRDYYGVAAAFDTNVKLTAFPDLIKKNECLIRPGDRLAVYARIPTSRK